MRRPSLALILICALYLVHRALVMHTNFDSVCIPNYELFPMGDIGKIAMGDWHGAPLRDFYDNCGGHLMTGLFAAPLYSLFGDSYLVLKLVPVLLGLGCVLLIASLGTRMFGRNAGLLAAFLFVVGPPTLVKYSMLAKGNHFENLFFQLFMMWAFVRLHESGKRWLWLPVFGIAAGFSIFFYFGSMLMVLLLIATHLAIRFEWHLAVKAFVAPLKDLALLAVPFAIGLGPLIWVQWGNQRPGKYIDDHLVGGSRWSQMTHRFGEFTEDLLPRATCFEDLGPISGTMADKAYLALFLLVWTVGLVFVGMTVWRFVNAAARGREHTEKQRFERLKLAPLVGYFPLFVVVYAVSSYRFDLYQKPVEIGQFRYMVPHFAFAPLLVAGVVHHLMKGRSLLPATLGRTIASASMLLGVFIVPLVDWSFASTGLGSQYAGYHWGYYKNALMRDTQVDPETGRFTWDFEAIGGHMDEFPREQQQAIAHGVGFLFAGSQLMDGVVDGKVVAPAGIDLAAMQARLPQAHWHPDLIRGAGTYLRSPIYLMDPSPAGLRKELDALLAQGNPMAEYVVEGLSAELEFPLLRNLEAHLQRSLSLKEAVPAQYMGAWYRGLGLQIGGVMRRGWGTQLELVKAQIAAIPAEGASAFWVGVGLGLAGNGEVPSEGAAWSELVPGSQWVHVWKGVGAGMRHAWKEGAAREFLRPLANSLEPGLALALEAGVIWPQYPSPVWFGGL
ncbi:MAG: hypothetical protein ACI87O_002598 [Planctomycetota bacterium]|jgi:hypothetical protein